MVASNHQIQSVLGFFVIILQIIITMYSLAATDLREENVDVFI
jgi:hypothetical protein